MARKSSHGMHRFSYGRLWNRFGVSHHCRRKAVHLRNHDHDNHNHNHPRPNHNRPNHNRPNHDHNRPNHHSAGNHNHNTSDNYDNSTDYHHSGSDHDNLRSVRHTVLSRRRSADVERRLHIHAGLQQLCCLRWYELIVRVRYFFINIQYNNPS
jgi:hypothetical protein